MLLFVLAFFGLMFFAGSLLRAGVETGGTYVLNVETKVGGGKLNILTGNVGLSGIRVANPPGFKSDRCIVVEDVDVKAQVGSLTSDTIVIDHIHIDGPEITLDIKGVTTNIGALMDQMKKSQGGGSKPPAGSGETGAASKKLKIAEVKITNGKFRVSESLLAGGGVAVPIPDIVIRDIGSGEKKDETDMAGLLQRILSEILKSAGGVADKLPAALANSVKSETEKVLKSVEGAAGGVLKGADDALKGVGEIFKKK